MFSKPALALVAAVTSASPMASLESAAGNKTLLEGRQVLSTDLYAIYNGAHWETNVSPGTGAFDGGHEVVLSAGFNIVTNQGQVLYSLSDIDDHTVCNQYGQQIEISGGCFPAGIAFRFTCAATADGVPGACAVWSPNADDAQPTDVTDCEDANTGLSYSVFSAGTEGQCVLGFTVGADCNPDLYSYEYEVTSVSDMVPPPCNECPSCS